MGDEQSLLGARNHFRGCTHVEGGSVTDTADANDEFIQGKEAQGVVPTILTGSQLENNHVSF